MIGLGVVNYNTIDKLMRLIETLHQDTDENDRAFRLVIADNGSTDGSPKQLERVSEKYGFDYHLFDNIGYARACNQLAVTMHASTIAPEVMGFLNADVWLTNGDVKNIEKSFMEDDTVGILGPKQRNESGQIVHAGIFGTNEKPKHRGWKQLDPNDSLYLDKVEAVTVSGSAYFVRRSVWDALTACRTFKQIAPEADGAFLPTPHYYEETWCSYHARAHGYKVFYDGSVSIGHSWHASHSVGSIVDKEFFHSSQQSFRAACRIHDIPCD